MRKQLYIGTVVIDEIGYKYTVEKVPSKEDLVEGELEESAEESDNTVYADFNTLLANLPKPLNTIGYINPAFFPCVVLIEPDAEYGKEEVTQEFEETTNDEEK